MKRKWYIQERISGSITTSQMGFTRRIANVTERKPHESIPCPCEIALHTIDVQHTELPKVHLA